MCDLDAVDLPDGFDVETGTLSWNCDHRVAEMISLARRHRAELRVLRIKNLRSEEAMKALIDWLPKCLLLTSIEFRSCGALHALRHGLPESLGTLPHLCSLRIKGTHADIPLLPWAQRHSWDELEVSIRVFRFRGVTLENTAIRTLCLRDGGDSPMFYIPDCLNFFPHLHSLTVSYRHFCALPETFGQSAAAALQTLEIYSVMSCETPKNRTLGNIMQLAALRTLRFRTGISLQQQLLAAVQRLDQLETLAINDFVSFSSMDIQLHELRGLETLEVVDCKALARLPELLPPGLQRLTVARCPDLVRLPALPSSLRQLTVLDCHRIHTDINVTSLGRLTTLDVSMTPKRQVVGLSRLASSLTTGRFTCTDSLLPDDLDRLAALETLTISVCPHLIALPSLVGLKRLATLVIENCFSLHAIPDSVGKLIALRSLTIRSCCRLRSLPESIGQLAGLESLSITSCGQLTSLPESLCSLAELRTFELTECRRLSWTPRTPQIPQTPQTPQTPADSNWWPRLHRLHIGLHIADPPKLPQVLTRHDNVVQVIIDSCPTVQSLDVHYPRLTLLELIGCYGLSALPDSLGQLSALETLNINNCGLTALPDCLGNLSALTTLRISFCPLASLPESVGRLSSLRLLSVRDCFRLCLLPESLGQTQRLESLILANCESLTSLPKSLGLLQGLRELDLSFSHRIRRLPMSAAFFSDALMLILPTYVRFPPPDICHQGILAIKAFLLARHRRFKMLLLILAARRRRIRHPPAELWVLILDEFIRKRK